MRKSSKPDTDPESPGELKRGFITIGLLVLSYYMLPELWDTVLALDIDWDIDPEIWFLIAVVLMGVLLGIYFAIRFVLGKFKRN